MLTWHIEIEARLRLAAKQARLNSAGRRTASAFEILVSSSAFPGAAFIEFPRTRTLSMDPVIGIAHIGVKEWNVWAQRP